MNTALINKKVEYWENQLLDLGKRNKMISFRETKRATLRILEPDFVSLYGRLVVKEEELTFQKPVDKDSDIRVYSVLSLMDSLSAPVEVKLGDIKTAGTVEESKKTLKDLRNKARLSLDEQGTNILYLVFGFVEWREKGSKDKDNWIKSPLILVPVSIALESLNAPYVLKKYEDDLVVNPTLAYLFERDYGITLPEFDPDEDSLESFMTKMEQLVDVRGWRVLRETSLGLVSFLKISMYKDLLNNEEDIKKNPIIQAFAGDSTALHVDAIDSIDFNHDNGKSSDLYQVVDADSSQQDAILLSQKGISFVMQGPPGTGKSQTITNIIAQGLADGKKILFVSEKMAALEVVHRRLEEVHLADFCLALHSHKANKKEILEQLGQNLSLKHIKVKDEEIAKLTRLDVLRDSLRGYVEDIHNTLMPLEMSLYEVYGAIAELQELPFVRLILDGIGDYSKDQVNRMALLIENLEMTRGALGPKWYKNPWQGVTISRLGNVQKKELSEKMSSIEWILHRVPSIVVIEDKNILQLCDFENMEEYFAAFSLRDKCEEIPETWVGKDLSEEKQLLCDIEKIIKGIDEKKSAIAKRYTDAFFAINPDTFLKDFNEAGDSVRKALGDDYTNSILFEKQADISSDLKKILEQAFDVKRIFEKMNSAYEPTNTDNSMGKIRLLLDVCLILMEKARLQQEACNLENEILTECENSVFDIDFENMFNRFKVEYTGFFRIFNKQYRADIKLLRICYKNVKKKISNDEAILLLQKLKDRKAIYEQKNGELDKAANTLGLPSFMDIDSVLTVEDVETTKNMISEIEEGIKKYASITCDNVEEGILKVSRALEELAVLQTATEGIKIYVKNQSSYENIDNDLKDLKLLNALDADYSSKLKTASETFTFRTIDKETDWESIKILINDFEEFVVLPVKTGIREEWIRYISDVSKQKEIAIVKQYLCDLISKKSLFEYFINMFSDDVRKGLYNFEKLMIKLSRCQEQFETLDLWIDYRDCKDSCEKSGLGDFVVQTEDIIFPEGQLNKVFMKAFYYAWIGDAASKGGTVAGFNSRIHSDNVEKFRELDTHQLPVAQMRIREKLIEGMPDKSMFNRAGDEMSVLIHELGKKRKIMPLRKLFKSMPNLLLKLKPCLMMSPLSVSYFLEADTYKFDMVIFDEASQIFPQDAIGAIFRGAQVIIAGDSKQLPPTNFFAASTNNDSDYDSDDDDYDEIISDSILEEATNTIPNRSLLWHYRSRYEDLISFSNKEIYGNNLVTFPSSKVNEADSGVEYIYVKSGVYENRCNKEEAAVCVRLIEEHIKKHPERSLGIIAFSESQQSTIEDAVQEFRRKHRQYDGFFAEDKEEAFFIKNLENVQGDERDTIIFSICYGKNSQGRMFMRFGPLGHQGGERRLNVAITRAKYNVKLVGSIQPEDIDLDKTKSEGVRMLRSYIEFASRAEREAIPAKKKNRLYETDIFSESVAAYLEERGYKVKRNIGTSDYTVDMAIEHPEIPGAYIAGIECDGDSYQMARTVRDRDHLRVAVMERMGWKMYRVWSTEWIQNEEVAKKKLLDFISEALKNYSVFETIEKRAEEMVAKEEIQQKTTTQINSSNPYNLDRYQEGHWWDVKSFRANDNESRIADRMHEVIRVEQPIHLELLYKRMAGCFGNEKVTKPIRDTVDYVLKRNMRGEIKIDRDNFISLSDFTTLRVRRSLAGCPDRNIEHISIKEIEDAMKLVLTGAYGVEVPALILETARIFGYEKTGAKIKQRMQDAIASLEKQGAVRVSDERVQLLEG